MLQPVNKNREHFESKAPDQFIIIQIFQSSPITNKWGRTFFHIQNYRL